MTSEDVSSLCDKSFSLMRSAFLDVSDSVTQSNGPMRHWTFTIPTPSFLLRPFLRPIPLSDLPTLPGLSHYLARKQHDTGLLSWNLFLSSWRLDHTEQSVPTLTVSAAAPAAALLCTPWAEWRTASRTVWMCVVLHACLFGWLCPPSSLLCSLALEA